MKAGLYTAIVPIPDEIVLLVGRVAINWGHLEYVFNTILGGLLEALEMNEPGWQSLAFKRRLRLFRDALKQFEPTEQQALVRDRYRKALNQASMIAWKRNLVVHSYIGWDDRGEAVPALFNVQGRHNGKPVTLPLQVPALEKMWHDIAHITGELIQITKLIGDIGGFLPPFPDTHLLQMYDESMRRNSPIVETGLPPL